MHSVRASAEGLKGDQGQKAVGGQFLALRWGVTENPPPHDLGTDLWSMARDTRRFDLDALLGAQVKYGSSWFGSPQRDEADEIIGWWHADSQDHFKYWAGHRLPHILVLHCPQTSVSYWVHVTPEKVVHTGKGAKNLVPRDQDGVATVGELDVGNTLARPPPVLEISRLEALPSLRCAPVLTVSAKRRTASDHEAAAACSGDPIAKELCQFRRRERVDGGVVVAHRWSAVEDVLDEQSAELVVVEVDLGLGVLLNVNGIAV